MSLDPELASMRLRLFRDLDRVVEALEGLDAEQAAWKPLEAGSSLIVLVTHVFGSAENTLVQLAGQESSRDRDREFLAPWSVDSVRENAEEAKARMAAALDRLDPATLAAERSSPRSSARPLTVPAVTTQHAGGRTVRDWLLQALAHAAEHAGHAELTRDLVRARR